MAMWRNIRGLAMRFVFLFGASLALASCAGFGQCQGVGPCTGKMITGPYDQADLYVDAQGFPVPGWAMMKYGPDSSDGNR
jgi:hypothetical protein